MPHVPGDDESTKAAAPAVAWAAAMGAVVLGGAQGAFAGDVQVERQGARVVVTGTAGSDDVLIEPDGAGMIKVTGQFGSTVDGGASASIAIGAKDTLVVQLGEGSNGTTLSGVLPPFAGLLGLGRAGNDRWTISDATLSGGAKFEEAGGDNFWTVQRSRIGKSFLIAGGAGADSLVSSQSEYVGKVTARFGAGPYNGGRFSNDTLRGGANLRGDINDDQFVFLDSTLEGAVKIDGGAGADYVVFSAATAKAPVKIRSGADPDYVSIVETNFQNKLTLDLGTEGDLLFTAVNEFGKNASIKLGDGDDTAYLGDVTARAKLVLLGGAGNDTVRFDDTLGSTSAKDILLDGGAGSNQRTGTPSLQGGGMLIEKHFPK